MEAGSTPFLYVRYYNVNMALTSLFGLHHGVVKMKNPASFVGDEFV